MTAPSADVLAELSAGGTASPLPHVIDDLTLSIEQDPGPPEGGVAPSAALWVGNLRRIAAKKLAAAGLSALADDAELLISELLTNAFQHGAGRVVAFRLVIGVDTLVIEVDDGSPHRPEVRTAGPDEENGRGMFLVDALADAWGASADGTRTWCTLALPSPAVSGRPPTPRGREEGPP